jgi:hypothetical protein
MVLLNSLFEIFFRFLLSILPACCDGSRFSAGGLKSVQVVKRKSCSSSE